MRPDTPRRGRPPRNRKRRRYGVGFWASLAIIVLVVAFVQVILASQPHPTGQRIKFSTFVSLADTGALKSATILDQDSYVEGTYQHPGGPLVHFNTPYLKSATNSRDNLVSILTSNQVPLTIDQQYGKSLVPVLALLLPGLIVLR